MLHDTLSPEAQQTAFPKEGDEPPHLAVECEISIDDANKTIENDRYLWLDKRWNMLVSENNWVASKSERLKIDKKNQMFMI